MLELTAYPGEPVRMDGIICLSRAPDHFGQVIHHVSIASMA